MVVSSPGRDQLNKKQIRAHSPALSRDETLLEDIPIVLQQYTFAYLIASAYSRPSQHWFIFAFWYWLQEAVFYNAR